MLEYDRDKRDYYDRILAYVWLDTLFVNAEIVRLGYGRAYLKYPFKKEYMELFQRLEEEAKEGERGMWKGSNN